MKTIERLYYKLKKQAQPEKRGFLFPVDRGYKASASTQTGGSVWKGGKFTREERFFENREDALAWIQSYGTAEENILEVVFSDASEDFKGAMECEG